MDLCLQYCIRSLIVVATILLINYQGTDANIDRNYVGVVFSPHVKNKEGPGFPPWNSYSREEVGTMLELVSTKFKRIATYGMGTTSATSTWESGDAVGYTGVEAAKLNQRSSETKITVALGIWQHNFITYVNNAIKTAFDVTEEANRIHSGTVWGITLTSNFIQNSETANKVNGMITFGRNMSTTRNIPVKLGVRVHICDELMIDPQKVDYFVRILKIVDYVICFKNPPTEPARAGVPYAVKNMADAITDVREAILEHNPNIEVMVETGWPSAGISKTNVPTSMVLMKEFWDEISPWASAKKIPLFLFAAIDEPWKSELTDDKTSHAGPCGAEGHYGWWRRVDNKDPSIKSYVEKINEPQLKVCEANNTRTIIIQEKGNGVLIGSVVGVVLFIGALTAILLLYIKLRKAKAEKLTEEDIAEFEKGVELTDEEAQNFEVALRLPYDRNFELEKDKFHIDKHAVLGSGAFGIVYKGKIDGNDDDVAFKTTKPRCPVDNLKGLLSEIKLMIYIGKHENIVGLVAAYTGQLREGEVFIASEFCALGSLESFLRNAHSKYVNVKLEISNESAEFTNNEDDRYVNSPRIVVKTEGKGKELSLKNFVIWSYHIANGMDYLGSKNVIHADLATRNVLLTETGVAKITDFGLSRKLYAYTNYVKKKEEPLPWRWMSIESLKQLTFSTQSDVWSYGVTLWEIFSLGDVPYPGMGWELEFVEKLNNGLRLKKPHDATPEIYTQMSKCWYTEPEQRPTFKQLADFFLGLSQQLHEINYASLE